MAARLASYTSSFLELEDVDGGISRQRLLHRFMRVFGTKSKLTEMHIRRFAHFVFDGMNKDRSEKPGSHENTNSLEFLDIEEWLKACVVAEPLHYD